MTGEHLGFVRKQVKLLFDVGNQGLMVATGQISAADASSKEYVAAYQDLLFRHVKAKAAGTMARNEEYLEPET